MSGVDWQTRAESALSSVAFEVADLHIYSMISFWETSKCVTKSHKLKYNSFAHALYTGFEKCSLWQRF